MATKITPEIQALIDASVAAALAKRDADRDINTGALFLSRPTDKSDMSGRLNVEGVEYSLWAYATGHDGSQMGKTGNPLPVYRLSFALKGSAPKE
jgi:hypothetical protein